MTASHRSGLFWRLLASYLLVILVGCFTLFWAGEAFSVYFFEQHMGGMMQQLRHTSPMMEAMEVDLSAAYRQATERSMVWGMSAAAVVASLAALFVTRRIVAPLRRLQSASRRIAAGQYRERLETSAPGEIGELATSFNEMAQALERIEARRVELLANVAHEFRTPLTNLRGFVTGLRDGVFQPDEETLDACTRQLARLERLLADLSLLSRVETGQERLQPQALDVTDFVCQSVAAFRPRFREKGVALRVQTPHPPAGVLADPQRTAQVLANLLENALKHTPAGGTVRVRVTPGPTEVRFEVRDTGQGIACKDRPHVFTRFYRVDKARSHDPAGGSGIGLTIAKHYVERQGGHIGLESEPGLGSCFWFTLPPATAPERALPPDPRVVKGG